MPALLDPKNVYAADAPGQLSPVVRADPALVYVPNSKSNTVDVIDQRTYKIVNHFAVGGLPQHVVPSYDLRTLWVNNNDGYTLTPIDPRTGRPGRPVPVADPYNLYFTPDGKFSVIMAEARREIIFSDPHTMRPKHVLAVPGCNGVNHADFSADGRYFIATCEFAGRLIKVDVEKQKLVGTLPLATKSMPQDIKIAPDGSVWYVADMENGGVWLIDGDTFRKVGFIRTGLGAHGLYPRRDAKVLYVTNRGEGSISLISFATRKVITTWRIPGGGSPDMGGLNAAGTVLWLTGRYDSVVYAINAANGHLIRKIPVGAEPHGLCVYPQPGRYSLGHTGILR
ncbi:MAG: YncE family protein [Actinomycetota bacterium]|nr:YncE family protein [Actinomycetota bacterium]